MGKRGLRASVAILSLALLMVACANVQPPAVVDIQMDVPGGQAEPSPWLKLPSGPDTSLGLVLSTNSKNNRQYLQQLRQTERQGIYELIHDEAFLVFSEAVADPDFIPAWMGRVLHQFYNDIQVYDSVEHWREHRPDLLGLVNIRYEWAGGATTALIELHLYDTQLRPIGVAKGEGQGYISAWSRATNMEGIIEEDYTQRHLVRVAALKQWEESLQQWISPALGNQEHDQCIALAVAVQNVALRKQAVLACAS